MSCLFVCWQAPQDGIEVWFQDMQVTVCASLSRLLSVSVGINHWCLDWISVDRPMWWFIPLINLSVWCQSDPMKSSRNFPHQVVWPPGERACPSIRGWTCWEGFWGREMIHEYSKRQKKASIKQPTFWAREMSPKESERQHKQPLSRQPKSQDVD